MTIAYRLAGSPFVRVVLAIGLMAPMTAWMLGSGGGCIMYYYDNFAGVLVINTAMWLGFPLFFLVGFVWFIAEVVRPLISTLRDPPWGAAVASAMVGVVVYAAVGFGIWLQTPVPERFYPHERTSGRLYTSFYWPIGIRVLEGTTSRYTCGQ